MSKFHAQDLNLHDAIARLRSVVGEDEAAEIVSELMQSHQTERVISEIELVISLRKEAYPKG